MRFLALLVLTIAGASLAQAKSFYVEGAGGVPLAVTDIGPPDAPSILFLHGIGFGRESFRAQFESSLAQKYRLVAFDLRGHGMSGKPWTAGEYENPAIWATDVMNVMSATGLERPVIVAWSYGTFVAADAIRVHGTTKLGALMLVGGLGGLVEGLPSPTDLPADMMKAQALRQVLELESQTESSRLLAKYLTSAPGPAWWGESALSLNLMVPPYAQPLLRQRPRGNSDLVPRLRLPVLIAYGKHDLGFNAAAIDSLRRAIPGSTTSLYDSAGHSPFIEDSIRFNDELAAFVDRIHSNP
jgi:non-heme chloroperoxidase